MGYGTIRISTASHDILRQLSRAERKPMLVLLDEAVETLRRRRFLEHVNAAYATLRADPRTWETVEAERHAWDATLVDGLAVAEGRGRYGAPPRRKRGRKQR